MNEQGILQMLGLSSKAGRAVSGEFQCEEALKSGKARLVVVAQDVSANTYKKFKKKSEYYHVPFYQLSCNKEGLGRAIGKEKRSCVAVTDTGLAGSILKKMEEN